MSIVNQVSTIISDTVRENELIKVVNVNYINSY